ncbi:futalosine hydrolase [Nannocystis bainbridge]|uniref:Futalosine hydrolase n=1 Tax=Nannocystis bainbridge TaxID=2995303 RepID=A0ABT5EA12_9BACT|nr:futalosine hydrolase [Nannocystis bainbridge]MDC0722677.1 futalosine hydrolase [Nannocystis bainbridge]
MTAPLLVCAAEVEGRGLASPLYLGVGKVAAAVAMTRALLERRPAWVLLFGVCGAYPEGHGPGGRLDVGDVCLVGDEWLGDEGVAVDDGFLTLAQLGLGSVGPLMADGGRTAAAARSLGAPIVRGATVSGCSGTDASSRALAGRTGATVETMEGAAVAWACAAAGVPWVQLRCVSNRTGQRAAGGWDLPRAVAGVQAALQRLQAADWGNE